MLDCDWCGGSGWIGINRICGECGGSGICNEYYDSDFGWTKTKSKKILLHIPEGGFLDDFMIEDQPDKLEVGE